MRIALKVDCDTAIGTWAGIPRLLSLFEELGIRASFFFSLGPDRSGRAIFRVFTRKGFLRKMLRSKAPSLYPARTMMYGTLLPAPSIGRVCRAEIQSVEAAGHEVGVHAWDHVAWHDGLFRWSPEKTAKEYRKLHDAFAEIFARAATASAAPGWAVSGAYLNIRETYPLRYTSDTRNGSPFFPALSDRASRIPEIPSTLPTLDEMLGDPRYSSPDSLLDFFASAPSAQDVAVHTIHTEVEGGPYRDWFAALLRRWKSQGAEFVTLDDCAAELAANRDSLPVRPISQVTIPGRGGTVASGRAAS